MPAYPSVSLAIFPWLENGKHALRRAALYPAR
jgi:hypothetical protein